MKRGLKLSWTHTAALAVTSVFFSNSLSPSLIKNWGFGKKDDSKTQSAKENKPTKTYIWGNGIYQARPDAVISFRNFTPKLISNFMGEKAINLRDVKFGEYHEAGIDINGDVYIWRKHVLDSAVGTPEDSERKDIIHLDTGKNTKQISFSQGFLWILKENGEVLQHLINTKIGQENTEDFDVEVVRAPRKVKELKNITQISSGDDHFVALDNNGEVWVMGDDTTGQCGLGGEDRSTGPPFYERRVKKPQKLSSLSNIVKIVCGGNHTIALTKDGSVYGWGSNSNIQLSHQERFATLENPLIAIYAPVKLEKNMSSIVATDIAAGHEFSIIVGKNRNNGETELYGCGHNLHGELASGNLAHVQEIIKMESLSNFKIDTPQGEKDVRVEQISCGKNHCMALLSLGAVLEWGANEYGQLGNRKRVFSENPVILKTFTEENVVKISCGQDNSAVICEDVKKEQAPVIVAKK